MYKIGPKLNSDLNFSGIIRIQIYPLKKISQIQIFQPKIPKSGDWLWVPSKTRSFYLKTGRLEPKAKLWLAEPLFHYSGIYKGHTSSSYKFDESSCAFFDAILEMIPPSEFPIGCKQKPDSKPITDNGWLNSGFRYEKLEEVQKNRRITKKAGDKSKETRRFDKFVITGRFAFINPETERYKPKPGDLEGLQILNNF